MREKIFKIIVIAMIGLSTYGCGLFRKAQKTPTDVSYGTPAMYGQTMTINSRQLDSICTVDGISRNLDDWLSYFFFDYETNMKVDRYAYIKVLSETEEISYILTPVDTLYRITKRTVIEEDE